MRILFLTSEFPYPAESGGAIKTLSLINYLRARHELRTLCFNRSGLTDEQARWAGETGVKSVRLSRGRNLRNLALSYVSGLPLSIERNRSDAMRQLAARMFETYRPQAVFVDGWLMAQYLRPDFRGLKLLHEHNAEYVMWRRQAQIEKNPLRRPLVRLETRRVEAYEASALAQFDIVFAVSPADKRALTALGTNRDTVQVLPNLPDGSLLDLQRLSFEASEPVIFYFGTLSWQPNIEGLEYFLRTVLPLAREQVPEARLIIAGKGAPAGLQQMARATAGVEFLGPISDPEPYYRRARVFVEATRSGGGTKLKVLNALARGLPVAATPEALEGLDVEAGRHVLVGESAPALAQAVVRLLRESDIWTTLSENGRELVRERYTAATAYGVLDEVLSGAGAAA